MRISGSVEGSIAAAIAEQTDGVADGLRRGMTAAGQAVQAELRAQVQAAGLGPGLEKAWQRTSYPRGGARTLSPAELIYSKSTVLHRVFSEGATISATQGRFLAIPTRECEALGFATTNTTRAGKGTGSIPRRASQVEAAIAALGAANTRTIDLANGRKLIVYHVPDGRGPGKSFRGKVGFRRGQDVPLFILVPQVRLRPVLDIEGVRARAADRLSAEIAAALG